MDLDEFLGIDNEDPVQRLANDLVKADDRLLEDLVKLRRKTMTQQDVADRLGISRPAVAAFERYDADPRLSTVRRYAMAVRAHVEHTVTPVEIQRRETSMDRLLWHWQVDQTSNWLRHRPEYQHIIGDVVVKSSRGGLQEDTDSPVQDRRYHDSVKGLLSGKR